MCVISGNYPVSVFFKSSWLVFAIAISVNLIIIGKTSNRLQIIRYIIMCASQCVFVCVLVLCVFILTQFDMLGATDRCIISNIHCLAMVYATHIMHGTFDLLMVVYMDHHYDVIKWNHLPRYWPLVRGIHRSPVNSLHKGQGRGSLMFSLICALNGRLSKHSWGWWFETPMRSLWRHCNETSKSAMSLSGSALLESPIKLYICVSILFEKKPKQTKTKDHRSFFRWRILWYDPSNTQGPF